MELPVSDPIFALIHRGPHEDRPWQSLLSHLRQRLDCPSTGIILNLPSVGGGAIGIYDTDDEEANATYVRNFAATLPYRHLSPLDHALQKSGDVLTLDDVLDAAARETDEFCLRFMKPYDIAHQIGLCVVEPGGWKCLVGGQRRSQQQAFDEQDRAFFRAITAHFEIALGTFARITLLQSERQMLEDTLDRLTIGAFILDAEGRVLASNRVARSLLNEDQGLLLANGRLHLARPRDDAGFQAILRRAKAAFAGRRLEAVAMGQAIDIRADGNQEDFIEVLRVDTQGGEKAGILIRAIPPHRYLGASGPALAVYVSNAGARQMAQECFVAELFGLSPAEATVATLMANGLSLAAIAARQGVSEQTIRSSSKRIYLKTGVARQPELVRLIHTSVALLA